MDGNQRAQTLIDTVADTVANTVANAETRARDHALRANVAAKSIPAEKTLAHLEKTLAHLDKGAGAQILRIDANTAFGGLDALVTRRLMELGFLPGAQLTVVGFGLLGRDPIAVRLGGTKFALRRAEANKIIVAPSLKSALL